VADRFSANPVSDFASQLRQIVISRDFSPHFWGAGIEAIATSQIKIWLSCGCYISCSIEEAFGMSFVGRAALWERILGSERSSEAEASRPVSATGAAEKVGVTLRAVRHYEAEGLLPATRRGKRRAFLGPDLDRLRLIRNLRRLGMSLAAVRTVLVDLDKAGDVIDVDILRKPLAERRAELQAEIAAAQASLRDLTLLDRRLSGEEPSDEVIFAEDAAADRGASGAAA
jgi:DNA-binding transcriptional MerR regulator